MAFLLPATTIAEAWVLASRRLLNGAHAENSLILDISNPSLVRPRDLAVSRKLDAFLIRHEAYTSHTVAETIFPGAAFRKYGRDGVFRVYPDEIFPTIKKHADVEWGTYAGRMLCLRTDTKGREYRPLERCLLKMQDKKGRKTSAYELAFGTDISTYEDDVDSLPRMGRPCLSHLSFKLVDGRLDLIAMYRLHYYVQKAYGNLLGLARLQQFMATEVGVATGSLVCHSTRAEIEPGDWGMQSLRDLVDQCEAHQARPAGAEENA
jgi:hypothetical protein